MALNMISIGWAGFQIIDLTVVVLSSSFCGVVLPYLLCRNSRIVGTSGVIFPVMGLRRAARYLVPMALIIFWMKVHSRSWVSK